MTELRRTTSGRFSGALWGTLVAACGGLMVASINGFRVDFQLVAILGLLGVGLWLLLTALVTSGARSRSKQTIAAAPVANDDPDDDATHTDSGSSPSTGGAAPAEAANPNPAPSDEARD
ncbi:hypothetical protein [Demequina oxidasica]|uniref:hypothetical protein n=1 Tax=Demequina oxidasica TaxID=676199 RepID=UPI000780BBF8|nr:hypothetical protein [Demequina oxidasica]